MAQPPQRHPIRLRPATAAFRRARSVTARPLHLSVVGELLRSRAAGARAVPASEERCLAEHVGGTGTAADRMPPRLSLTRLRRAASGCRACHLWQVGTRTVFGEGLLRSRLMLVGEQPGDEEDRTGRPFVGPSGRLLDEVLDEAGIARDDAYVTNVVKHFKWEPRGKRRLHKKPNAREIGACVPWLEAEIEVVRPEVILCLGSTAAKTLLGGDFSVTRRRGDWIESPWAPGVMATLHPSAILRIRDREERAEARRRYVEDFDVVGRFLNGAAR